MPRDESPKTKEKNLKKLNVKVSRQQHDQLESLHLEDVELTPALVYIRGRQAHLLECSLEAWKIWKRYIDHESDSFKCKENPNAEVVLRSFADGMPMVYTREEIKNISPTQRRGAGQAWATE